MSSPHGLIYSVILFIDRCGLVDISFALWRWNPVLRLDFVAPVAVALAAGSSFIAPSVYFAFVFFLSISLLFGTTK